MLLDGVSSGITKLGSDGIASGVPNPLDRGVHDPGGPNTPGVNALPSPLGGRVSEPDRRRAAATGSGETGCDSRRIEDSTAVLLPAVAPIGGVKLPVLPLLLLALLPFSGNPDRRRRSSSGGRASPAARLGDSSESFRRKVEGIVPALARPPPAVAPDALAVPVPRVDALTLLPAAAALLSIAARRACPSWLLRSFKCLLFAGRARSYCES